MAHEEVHMLSMVNMTTRRTDREVLEVIRTATENEEVISIEHIANQLDCHRLTVIRSVERLESLNRIEVNRKQKPNRYKVLP